jgi:hypothetical protein
VPCTERERVFSCFKCPRLDPVMSQSNPVDALTPRVCKIILVLDRLAEKALWNWTGRHFVSSSPYFLSSYLHAIFPPFPVLSALYISFKSSSFRWHGYEHWAAAVKNLRITCFAAYVIKTSPIICMCRSSLCMYMCICRYTGTYRCKNMYIRVYIYIYVYARI